MWLFEGFSSTVKSERSLFAELVEVVFQAHPGELPPPRFLQQPEQLGRGRGVGQPFGADVGDAVAGLVAEAGPGA